MHLLTKWNMALVLASGLSLLSGCGQNQPLSAEPASVQETLTGRLAGRALIRRIQVLINRYHDTSNRDAAMLAARAVYVPKATIFPGLPEDAVGPLPAAGPGRLVQLLVNLSSATPAQTPQVHRICKGMTTAVDTATAFDITFTNVAERGTGGKLFETERIRGRLINGNWRVQSHDFAAPESTDPVAIKNGIADPYFPVH